MSAAWSRALVTGAASGLGEALARLLAARGVRVLATDRADAGDAPAGGAYRRLDVTSEDDWADARAWVEERWGGLDLLVNNAGVATGGRIDVVPMDEWSRVLDVNLLGAIRGARAFVPLFKSQSSGHLVNVASMAGLAYPPGMSSYVAAKAALVAVSETLRYELAPWGVRVTVACPGFIRTPLASSLAGADPLCDRVAAQLIEQADASADDVAAAVLRGAEAGRALVLTDREGRRAWWAKRWARRIYDRELFRRGAALRRAEEQP